ncbi:MAG: hypothetical protein O8C66_06930 [Candidatus Methanoperedens sp.]|nr:hypothetical protein [Candidatus Methanoperedens sp.]MCZ7370227.1 hypothetical protein [Candidatus Methanoperedens sp.]
MDPKIKSYLPLIIIFFVLGVVAGYLLHQPATIEKPIYINQTIETTVEKTVTATATPASTAIMTPTPTLTETPQPVPDFTVKIWNPDTDNPTYTIQLRNQKVDPNTLSINTGDTVLIRITDFSVFSPMELIINSSYTQNLGTSGAVVVTFNNKGLYSLDAIIPSGDPNVFPRIYGHGMITVN